MILLVTLFGSWGIRCDIVEHFGIQAKIRPFIFVLLSVDTNLRKALFLKFQVAFQSLLILFEIK